MAEDRPPSAGLAEFGPLLDRLEELFGEIEDLDDDVRSRVYELLDGVDAIHRLAVNRLADALGTDADRLGREDPAIGWLFQAYGVGVDDVAAATTALDAVRPYITEHGGDVEVLDVHRGVVRVRLSGACSGCTSAAATLRYGVEEALRNNLPGYVAIDVAADSGAAPHPPPDPVLLQIQPRPA